MCEERWHFPNAKHECGAYAINQKTAYRRTMNEVKIEGFCPQCKIWFEIRESFEELSLQCEKLDKERSKVNEETPQTDLGENPISVN